MKKSSNFLTKKLQTQAKVDFERSGDGQDVKISYV